ncbi:MAG: hypothetical protein WEB52_05120 [Dehalococcoidia bacterium]
MQGAAARCTFVLIANAFVFPRSYLRYAGLLLADDPQAGAAASGIHMHERNRDVILLSRRSTCFER